MRWRLTPAAENDIRELLHWSEENFGIAARIRYESLIKAALRKVAKSPRGRGCRKRPELFEDAFTYHLRYSRDIAAISGRKVKQPRHFLIYRIRENWIEIIRILHEKMDLPGQFED